MVTIIVQAFECDWMNWLPLINSLTVLLFLVWFLRLVRCSQGSFGSFRDPWIRWHLLGISRRIPSGICLALGFVVSDLKDPHWGAPQLSFHLRSFWDPFGILFGILLRLQRSFSGFQRLRFAQFQFKFSILLASFCWWRGQSQGNPALCCCCCCCCCCYCLLTWIVKVVERR